MAQGLIQHSQVGLGYGCGIYEAPLPLPLYFNEPTGLATRENEIVLQTSYKCFLLIAVKAGYDQLLYKQLFVISNFAMWQVWQLIKVPKFYYTIIAFFFIFSHIKLPIDNFLTPVFDLIHQNGLNLTPYLKQTKGCSMNSAFFLKPHISNLYLKQWFEAKYNQQINTFSISQILSAKYSFFDFSQFATKKNLLKEKQHCPEHWPELEKALFDWLQCAEGSIAISQEVIREKARQFWPLLYPEK